MAHYTVPTDGTGNSLSYEQTTTLDGVPYILSFDWNARFKKWLLSIAASNGDDLASGIVVVANQDLHLGEDPSDPGLADLGNRVALTYVDQESSEEIRA